MELLKQHRGDPRCRPVADRLASSTFHNIEELRWRSGGAQRELFALDPRREAIRLGGDNDREFGRLVQQAVPEADRLYAILVRTATRGLI